MKRTIRISLELSLLVIFLGLLTLFISFRSRIIEPASQAYPPPYPPLDENPSPISTQVLLDNPCYIDKQNQFSVKLPTGWQASEPPDAEATGGASVFYNYKPGEVQSNHGMSKLPINAIKIQITSAQLNGNQSLEQWVKALVNATNLSEVGKQYTTTATTPYPYELANYKGMTYTVNDVSGTRMLVIDLLVEDNRVLIMAITPSDSPALDEVLSFLSTLKTSGIETCSFR